MIGNNKEPKLHSIKLNTRFVDAVAYGLKTFEVRKNDRNYCIGDYVLFNVVNDDGKMLEHPIQNNIYQITYVLHIPVQMDAYGINLKDDTVVFSIRKLSLKEKKILLAYEK